MIFHHFRSHCDVKLIILIVLSASVSLITLWCAEPLLSSSLRNSDLWLKQLIWYILGALLIVFMNHLDPHRINTWFKFLYWLLMIFLFLLWIDRKLIDLPDSLIRSINGTTAWIQIPGLGSFQPSELMKVVLIVRSGYLIDKHFQSLYSSTFLTDIQLFIKLIRLHLIPLVLILMQPDTGIPIVIVFGTGIMLLTSPVQRKWILAAAILLVFCFSGIILLHTCFPELFEELGGYRLRRISGWLNPEGTMRNEGYQLYTSLLMFGSCGLFGCGIKKRIISIPEAHTDFIFTVAAQNFGLCGTLCILALCLTLDFHLMKILYHEPNSALKRISIGLVSILMFQQFQNMGMVIGLLPITGIPLPLFSYGGSSILSTMMMLSLFFIMSSRQKLAHSSRNKV